MKWEDRKKQERASASDRNLLILVVQRSRNDLAHPYEKAKKKRKSRQIYFLTRRK
jgi:hypothetical protein